MNDPVNEFGMGRVSKVEEVLNDNDVQGNWSGLTAENSADPLSPLGVSYFVTGYVQA